MDVERESGVKGYSRRWMGVWGYRAGLSSRREYVCLVSEVSLGCANLESLLMFRSLKYHRLHPEYLHTRIEAIRGMYLLRVLLLMCDIVSRQSTRWMCLTISQSEHQEPIREITKICLINEITVMTAWRYASHSLPSFPAYPGPQRRRSSNIPRNI
jgi:hypothetical protein